MCVQYINVYMSISVYSCAYMCIHVCTIVYKQRDQNRRRLFTLQLTHSVTIHIFNVSTWAFAMTT